MRMPTLLLLALAASASAASWTIPLRTTWQGTSRLVELTSSRAPQAAPWVLEYAYPPRAWDQLEARLVRPSGEPGPVVAIDGATPTRLELGPLRLVARVVPAEGAGDFQQARAQSAARAFRLELFDARHGDPAVLALAGWAAGSPDADAVLAGHLLPGLALDVKSRLPEGFEATPEALRWGAGRWELRPWRGPRREGFLLLDHQAKRWRLVHQQPGHRAGGPQLVTHYWGDLVMGPRRRRAEGAAQTTLRMFDGQPIVQPVTWGMRGLRPAPDLP